MKVFKRFSLWILIFLLILTISGCGIGFPFHGRHHGYYHYGLQDGPQNISPMYNG